MYIDAADTNASDTGEKQTTTKKQDCCCFNF